MTGELIEQYGRCLAQQVSSGEMKVGYAQNLLSTVNVVLESLRQDRKLRVSPAAFVGNRTNIRQIAPEGLDRLKVEAAADALRHQGHDRVAAAVELARDLGLRFREASVNDRAKKTLEASARTNSSAGNLIPADQRLIEWRDYAVATWQAVSKAHELSGFHDLRAAYACERYQQLTGQPAPIVAGQRSAAREGDQVARQTIAQELGHGRTDVVAAYIGSSK